MESGQGETKVTRDGLGRVTSIVAPNGQSLKYEWSKTGVRRVLEMMGAPLRLKETGLVR